ncbi:MAG: archease [Candidatus Atribacteria bacterium]|nr:archease [Candidatus Atribacteria bacterium]
MNENTKVKDFKVIEHTADVGLNVYGKDKEELFINAARGMFYLTIGSVIAIAPNEYKKYYNIESTGTDVEDLLVNWLEDLLFVHNTEFIIFTDFLISAMTEEMIKAKAGAIKLKGSPYQVTTEIKAVTYHNLRVSQEQSGRWEGTVVFDI